MVTTTATQLLSPEEIAVQAGQQVPYVRTPNGSTVFAEREARLRQLAAGHPMRDYLLFAAELARAQHQALQQHPAVPLPTPEQIDAASRQGAPTLPAEGWLRDAAWRGVLRTLLADLARHLGGGENPALAAVQRVAAFSDDELERYADRLLGGVTLGLDLAAAPLVAAGLQVYWTHLVTATQAARGSDRLAPFGRTDEARTCPACGCPPVASISRIGDASGYRYLHCALCSTQWHMVRVKCPHCEGTKGIEYQSLEAQADATVPATGAAAGAVQAETCSECGHYTKIVHMAKDNDVEPVADDLASLTLDLLLGDSGLERHGVNFLLLFGGEAEAGSEAAEAGSA